MKLMFCTKKMYDFSFLLKAEVLTRFCIYNWQNKLVCTSFIHFTSFLEKHSIYRLFKNKM